jgi:hypothetical protein
LLEAALHSDPCTRVRVHTLAKTIVPAPPQLACVPRDLGRQLSRRWARTPTPFAHQLRAFHLTIQQQSGRRSNRLVNGWRHTLTEWLATALAEPPQENSLVRSQAHHATVLRTLDSAGMRVCVECLIGKQKKPILFKVTELSSIPYRAPPGAPKWRRTRTPHP